jgi:hypothetical protein
MKRQPERTLQEWTFEEHGAPVDAAGALEYLRGLDDLLGRRRAPLKVGPTTQLHMPGPIEPKPRKQRRKARR